MQIKFTGNQPVYASDGAVGADVVAVSYDRIVDYGIIIYDTGTAVEVPEGYEIQVRARSNLTESPWYIPHGIGTIDQDYRGTIKVVFACRDRERNIYDIPPPYQPGERCAQLVLAPVVKAEFVTGELTKTDRADKGFGSTGKMKLNIKKRE